MTKNNFLKLGYDYDAWHGYGKRDALFTDISLKTNSHMILCGMSGSGKSYALVWCLKMLILASPPEVCYISGHTGTGKTRGVLEAHNFIDVYRITDYKNPFDGYRCQPVIAFDEFRSSLRLKEMLLYCDIYPLELPSRYANKYACYNKVYIISNWALERQYPEAQREDRESWEAFLRRIHKVITYDDKGKKIIYPSVQAYFERDTDFRTLTAGEQQKLPFAEKKD